MDSTANSYLGWLLVAIPLLPLVAALIGYLAAWGGGKLAPRFTGWLGGLALTASAALSGWLLIASQQADSATIGWQRPWITLPDATTYLASGGQQQSVEIPLAFAATGPQLLFALTTAVIGLIVLIFAGREREGDPRRATFFATLALFAGSMLLFLTADTLLVVYFAWELMGLCSYLLIAYPGTDQARRAARQAFWTTRATDFGLLFMLILMMANFGWTRLSAIQPAEWLNRATELGAGPDALLAWFGTFAVLLLLAVIGKAAQLPLCFWLPDAMVAPAPVSALLHAATMVAAGPYLLVRLQELMLVSETALVFATIVGGLTLLAGALMALTATDPKRVLAYSTVSHLGLVVLSTGVVAGNAGLYHLLAHAWFKAALFLGVGYLVAVWAAGQVKKTHTATVTELAGQARRHPLLLWGVLVPAGLSLAGLWPLAGALGKEQVLNALLTRYGDNLPFGQSFQQGYPVASAAWWAASGMLILALPLTAAYIVRLVGILGWGKAPAAETAGGDSGEPAAPPARSGWSLALMLTALMALTGSIGGTLVYFGWYTTDAVLGTAGWLFPWRSPVERYGLLVLIVSLVLVLAGSWLAWHLRVARPRTGDRVFHEGGMAPLADFLRHGMYLRELFHLVCGRFGEFLAVLAGRADVGIVDWLVLRLGWFGRLLAAVSRWVDDHIIDGLRWLACEFWWFLKRLHSRTMQTGQIQHYMFIVLLGAALLCLLILRPLSRILADILGSI